MSCPLFNIISEISFLHAWQRSCLQLFSHRPAHLQSGCPRSRSPKIQMKRPRCNQGGDIRCITMFINPRDKIGKAVQYVLAMNAFISRQTAISYQTFDALFPRADQPGMRGAHRMTVTADFFANDFGPALQEIDGPVFMSRIFFQAIHFPATT